MWRKKIKNNFYRLTSEQSLALLMPPFPPQYYFSNSPKSFATGLVSYTVTDNSGEQYSHCIAFTQLASEDNSIKWHDQKLYNIINNYIIFYFILWYNSKFSMDIRDDKNHVFNIPLARYINCWIQEP